MVGDDHREEGPYPEPTAAVRRSRRRSYIPAASPSRLLLIGKIEVPFDEVRNRRLF